MDATAWVGIAGIVGTLLAPVLTERMRRESVRREQITSQRLVVYTDLLRVTARLADNAMTWSAIPLADLKETHADELDRLISQVRVIASHAVYKHLNELAPSAHEFNRLLFTARLHHQRVLAEGNVDDAQSIQQRTSLGAVAHKLVESHKQLEAAIRSETRP